MTIQCRIAMLFLLLPLFALAQTVPNVSDDWSRVERQGYSISYPSNWRIDTGKAMGIDLFIFSLPDTTHDRFTENINVMFAGLNGVAVSLDSFVSVSEKEIRTMATDFNILESRRYQAPFEHHRIDFTARSGIFHLRFIQYYLITGGKAYTLTLSTEAAKFSLYELIGRKILDSFQVVE